MTYKNTILLSIGCLAIMMIKAQDTLKVEVDSTKTDTMIIQQSVDSVRVQQNDINIEMKRQLDFLKDLLEKKEDPNK